MEFYYLGLKEDAIKNSNFFEKSITIKGSNEKGNIAYNEINKTVLDYNDLNNFKLISEFYSSHIENVRKSKKDVKFMFYNQESVKDLTCSIEDDLVCVNDLSLLAKLNNKNECKKLLRKAINIVEYKVLKGKDIDFEIINKMFDNKYARYVVQKPVGFGGVGTFILNKGEVLELNDNDEFLVSGYIENNISLNNTYMISDKKIIVFPGSIQNIKVDEELLYDGWDFESYSKLDKVMQKKLKKQTIKICKVLKKLGYRGIGGIDYIVKDNVVYFMEINPRFQASSQELDKLLIDKGMPSLFELNYLSFYDNKKFVENYKTIKRNINV